MQNNSTVRPTQTVTPAAGRRFVPGRQTRTNKHEKQRNNLNIQTHDKPLTSQRAALPGHLLQVQDVQVLVQAVHGGHGGGLEHQQVLVERGQAGGGGQALDALDQVSVLALGLAHHLEEEVWLLRVKTDLCWGFLFKLIEIF